LVENREFVTQYSPCVTPPYAIKLVWDFECQKIVVQCIWMSRW